MGPWYVVFVSAIKLLAILPALDLGLQPKLRTVREAVLAVEVGVLGQDANMVVHLLGQQDVNFLAQVQATVSAHILGEPVAEYLAHGPAGQVCRGEEIDIFQAGGRARKEGVKPAVEGVPGRQGGPKATAVVTAEDFISAADATRALLDHAHLAQSVVGVIARWVGVVVGLRRIGEDRVNRIISGEIKGPFVADPIGITGIGGGVVEIQEVGKSRHRSQSFTVLGQVEQVAIRPEVRDGGIAIHEALAEDPIDVPEIAILACHTPRQIRDDCGGIKGLLVLPPAHIPYESVIVKSDTLPSANQRHSLVGILKLQVPLIEFCRLRIGNDRLGRIAVDAAGVVEVIVRGSDVLEIEVERKAVEGLGPVPGPQTLGVGLGTLQ